MNNFKLKRKILSAAEPPPPIRKDAFLRSLPLRFAGFHRFVLMQPAFVRKRVWAAAISFSLLTAVCLKLSGAVFTADNTCAVWVISAAAPFFALAAVCELFRSETYGMSEIENVCRFGKSSLAAARILIVGVMTFAVMAAVTLATGIFTSLGIAKAAIYILAPYSLSSGIFMEVLSRLRGRDGLFVCAAAAVFIGILGSSRQFAVYTYAYIGAIVLGMAFTVINAAKILKDGELNGAYN